MERVGKSGDKIGTPLFVTMTVKLIFNTFKGLASGSNVSEAQYACQ
jgi:hypothetical protein